MTVPMLIIIEEHATQCIGVFLTVHIYKPHDFWNQLYQAHNTHTVVVSQNNIKYHQIYPLIHTM